VPTEFQERNDVSFAAKLPGFTFASAERVARDALRAAERGRGSVVPGGALVRLAFGPNRYVPNALRLPVARRLMAVD
jgi:short-subunit dehydrogenase